MSMILTLKPRVSEKSYALSQAHNVYVFQVPSEANKLTVGAAVASQFKVTVTDVNITNIKGKPKSTVRKGRRGANGKRSDMKKAFVTLKEGDTIPIFAAQEQPAAETKVAKKDKK